MLVVAGVLRPLRLYSYGLSVERFLVARVDGRPVWVVEGGVEYRLLGDSCVALEAGSMRECGVEELMAAAERVEAMVLRERSLLRVRLGPGGVEYTPSSAGPPRVLIPASERVIAELVATGFTRSYAVEHEGLTIGFNLDGCVEAAWSRGAAACIEEDERVTRRRPATRLTVLGPSPI